MTTSLERAGYWLLGGVLLFGLVGMAAAIGLLGMACTAMCRAATGTRNW
jgi:hypothetical protein